MKKINLFFASPAACLSRHLWLPALLVATQLAHGQWSTGTGTIFATDTTRNVGIGTTAPIIKLQVEGGNIGQLSSGTFGASSGKWSALGEPPTAFPTGGDFYGLINNWAQQNFIAGLLDNGSQKDGVIAWQDQTSSSTTSGTRLRLGFIKGFGTGGGNPAVFSEKMTILANGRVGIGTASPNLSLHVNGDYYGRGHLYLYAFEGDGNSGNSYVQARDLSGTSSINLVMRTQQAGSISNDMVILASNGFVGINTISPGEQLTVVGDAEKTGGGSWQAISDRRLKKNISAYGHGLDIINGLKPVWFEYNGKMGIQTGENTPA
ncbi:MAG: tail fiber domain-containing protein [Cytophagales bacterium]|nr:tail fiber domain-containing protein [Cytophagales bacterium]